MRLVVLAPPTKMTSHAASISRIDPERGRVERRCIAATDVEWHSRVQWSTCSCDCGAKHPHHHVVLFVGAFRDEKQARASGPRSP